MASTAPLITAVSKPNRNPPIAAEAATRPILPMAMRSAVDRAVTLLSSVDIGLVDYGRGAGLVAREYVRSRRVGKAKRAHQLHTHNKKGGHGARAPLPTLRNLNHLVSRNMTVSSGDVPSIRRHDARREDGFEMLGPVAVDVHEIFVGDAAQFAAQFAGG